MSSIDVAIEGDASATTEAVTGPRRDEFRATPEGFEIRQAEDGMPTLVGNLAVFDQWTEIRSAREGHFLERLAPGAFTKTVAENSDRMRVLFQHGRDPSVGEKPLGPIRDIQIDNEGVHYEVDLLDTGYNRDLIPGLQAGLYGSSFRFEVMREDVNQKASRSEHNPKGLPERTVTELRMSEFGPVTFPAYAGAKSGIRSLTDEFAPGAPVVPATTDVAPPEDGEQRDDAHPETPAPPQGTQAKPRRARPVYSLKGKETPTWRLR